MSTANVIAAWAKKWEPRLKHLYDPKLGAKDPSYNEGWVFAVATPEANADLDRMLKGETT